MSADVEWSGWGRGSTDQRVCDAIQVATEDRLLVKVEYFRAALRTGIATVIISAALMATSKRSSAQAASDSVRTRQAPAITAGPIANLPGYDVFRPANLDAVNHKLPVVAWANGGCVFFNALWKPLFDAWVKAGFIVVAIGPNPSSKGGISTVADQEKIVDWAFSENGRKRSPYHNRLDPKGIVAAGNSRGGVTAVQLAAQDQRVHAVFVLSGSSTLPWDPTFNDCQNHEPHPRALSS